MCFLGKKINQTNRSQAGTNRKEVAFDVPHSAILDFHSAVLRITINQT